MSAERESRWSALMGQAQAGDAGAYKTLLRECHGLIHGYLRSRLADGAAVEDVAQETLLAIHKSRHTYDPKRPFTPWMMGLCHYKYVDYLRRRSRHEGREILDESLFAHMAATDEAAGANTELSDKLQKALQSLPEKQRVAVELLKVEGLSVKEAAVRTGTSESAVKVNAHRGYKALRRKLDS